ncbi:MAG: DNA mismatch repair protein MutS [Proteobacteria bacterium]|nr:DNA mismatch repair protein MutS [Pseudomonadota bacterium]
MSEAIVTANLTPAMRQYMEIKTENPDSVLFFRMGDFYEMFFDDAVLSARVLGIALTSRSKDKEIPMCGFPYHAAQGYIGKMVDAGHKVAVAEQVEAPGESKGPVKRAVMRIVTPGTVLDTELLTPGVNNFIAAVALGRTGSADKKRECGLAYMDVTTGEFRLTVAETEEDLAEELKRVDPTEVLVEEGASLPVTLLNAVETKKVTPRLAYDFELARATTVLNTHFKTHSLDGFGVSELGIAVVAAGALLTYIKSTQRSALEHVNSLTPYDSGEYLSLDAATLRNLEVIEAGADRGTKGSLLWLLDSTKTAMGARRLKSWLLYPLCDVGAINNRLDSVEELTTAATLRATLAEQLGDVYDLERLIVRVTLRIAVPRDLVALRDSLSALPGLKENASQLNSSLLSESAAGIDTVTEAVELLEAAISESPPQTTRDGGVIRAGFNADLDELRAITSGGKEWISGLEAKERERTGISTLKIGYNKVFGYYITVSRSKSDTVPDEYIRKQTLVNAERFITPELKEWEEKILGADESAKALELSLYSDVLDSISKMAERVQQSADALATLDTLISLATVAAESRYVKPEVTDSGTLMIEAGRHPVVERAQPGDFVPNELNISTTVDQILILTGPNMAGKSTYLRQNALIVLMAQIGSFVPATSASVGVVDRIFTRIGASDDLSRGQSTFMVEMNETANILNNATEKSLIILDEIGRGTSTFDGLSIAWSVIEFLHDHPGVKARTLFATHYHELTELSLTKERVKNYNMAVTEWSDKIVFLRKVVPGGASRSYGIQVAKLAGLPTAVVERATEILKNLEAGELNESGDPRVAISRAESPEAERSAEVSHQLNLLGTKDPVREELRKIEPERLTPIEALTLLDKLKTMADE